MYGFWTLNDAFEPTEPVVELDPEKVLATVPAAVTEWVWFWLTPEVVPLYVCEWFPAAADGTVSYVLALPEAVKSVILLPAAPFKILEIVWVWFPFVEVVPENVWVWLALWLPVFTAFPVNFEETVPDGV